MSFLHTQARFALALLALVAPAAAFAPRSLPSAPVRAAPLRAAAPTMEIRMVKPFNDDPTVGHLSTIVTSSAATKTLMANLPCYREGLTNKLRGLEVGLAHGKIRRRRRRPPTLAAR
jgi:hypothetical protein